MKKNICLFVFLNLNLYLNLVSCNTTEPPIIPPPDDTIANTIIVTTQWQDLNKIAVNFTRSQLDNSGTFTYKLKRKKPTGNEAEFLFMLSGMDTTFIDENLTKGTQYVYKVEAEKQEGKTIDTSKSLYVTTLDTTSHNITWQIDTLGQPGNFLNDVWGIDESNVYAVGYVSLSGNNSNIIKWDGAKWNSFGLIEGVLQGIYGFGENNIFVVGTYGSYGYAAIWNGASWNETNFFRYFPNGDTVWALSSVWGSSPEDVWAVGDQGTIIHWDGNEWQKVDAGITTRITAIWGISKSEIYFVPISGVQSSLFKHSGLSWEKIINNLGIFSTTLWKSRSGKLLIGGTSLLDYDGSMLQEIYIPGRTRGIVKIKGSNVNNVFTAGDFGEITHFNGLSWQDIDNFEVPDGRYRVLKSVWCTKNKVFIVGVDENRAIVITGIIN